MQDNRVLKLADDISYQEMSPGGQTVILSLSSGYLFTCNDTTRNFLVAMDGKRNFAQIMKILTDKYDVDFDKLREDMTSLAEKMLEMGLIQYSE